MIQVCIVRVMFFCTHDGYITNEPRALARGGKEARSSREAGK